MPVMKVGETTFNAGDTFVWGWWVAFPNNNPDIFVSWLVRPAYPPGHLGHPGHSLKVLSTELTREAADPSGRPNYFFEVRHTGFGGHTNRVEFFVYWEQI